ADRSLAVELHARAVELLLDAGSAREEGNRLAGRLGALREHRAERPEVGERAGRQRLPAVGQDPGRHLRHIAETLVRALDRTAITPARSGSASSNTPSATPGRISRIRFFAQYLPSQGVESTKRSPIIRSFRD